MLQTPEFTTRLIQQIEEKKLKKDEKNATQNNMSPKLQWCQKLSTGDHVAVYYDLNKYKKQWKPGTVTDVRRKNGIVSCVTVQYESKNETECVQIPNESDKIDPPNLHKESLHLLKENDKLDCYDQYAKCWRVGTVTEAVRMNSQYRYYVIRYMSGKTIHNTRRISHNNDSIAPFGSKTGRDRDPTFLTSVFGINNNHSNGTSTSNKNRCINTFTKKSDKLGSFYDAWLDMIENVHLNKEYNIGRVVKPKKIYELVSQYNPKLGDGKQHDAIETLKVLLQGIEESLPESLDYSNKFKDSNENKGTFVFKVPVSIYDEKYEWELQDDVQLIQQLAQRKMFGHETNLVSYFFDGIQVFQVYQYVVYIFCL